jgi:hypothetical protein
MDRERVSLAGSPIPGETGVRYRLAHAAQGLTISVPASDEVWVTHGCKRIRFTAAEARALSVDLLSAAEEATVG